METVATSQSSAEPAIRRLAALAPLTDSDIQRLASAAQLQRAIPPRRELLTEGRRISQSLIVLEGWAYRWRTMADGRRQVFDFILPGDLLGFCPQSRPLAMTTATTLTPMRVCSAPAAVSGEGGGLAEAYAVSHALEQSCWLRQMTRLGRLSAYERTIDWALEIVERLSVGLDDRPASVRAPVTQELLGDALGLTSVHVNRTLQALRRAGLLQMASGRLTLLDRDECIAAVDARPRRLSDGIK